MIQEESYYKQKLPDLIDRLKNSVDKISVIIDQDIDDDITDDKLFNVLKAKRQAAEDVAWTLKKIDELENELNGVDDSDNKITNSTNPTKKFARKNP